MIFEAIKQMANRYQNKGTLKMHIGIGGQFILIRNKEVEIAGRNRSEIWFVSALVQKGYVNFYHMPIFMNDPMKQMFSP